MSTPLLVRISGPITTITLNRPEKRNALNRELLQHLTAAVTAAGADATQRVVVLRGAGPVFCSGLDLAEAANPGFGHESAEALETALRAIATSRLITIAAVQGAAVAGGAGLMNACDFAIATADAKFGYPEVRRGIVPALIMTFLRRQIRERDARDLLLRGRLCDAQHAVAIGLINGIAAEENALEVEVQRFISSILQGGPETLATTKRLIEAMWPNALETDFERARAAHIAGRTSAEAKEGIAAFNEKRTPKWAPEK